MLNVGKRIQNGEAPVMCFFGDSVTHGEFEFQNGYKESAARPELAYHSLLKKHIQKEFGVAEYHKIFADELYAVIFK